jgi:hypothetical protein
MNRIYTPQSTEKHDLVSSPVENEWLELKSWVDLSTNDHTARADTARHMAAISNYGGGYIVFGFEDDGTRCARKYDVRTAYAQDVFAAIIDKYLRPKFQCEVTFLECEDVEHPIVWVPSHGESPVIGKADGPKDAKGNVQGIRLGTVYIRTPKPESASASTPELWDKIILRCVLARRFELVSMFSAIFSGDVATPETNGSGARLEKSYQVYQHAGIRDAGRDLLAPRVVGRSLGRSRVTSHAGDAPRTSPLDHPPEVWEKAKMRLAYVMEVLDLPDSRARLIPAIERVWQKLRQPERPPNATTVVRWRDKFDRAGGELAALVDQHKKKGNKTLRFPHEVQRSVQQAIESVYLTQERKSIQKTLEWAHTLVQLQNSQRPPAAQLRLPSLRLVTRMIKAIPAFDVHAARFGHTSAVLRFGERFAKLHEKARGAVGR